MRVHKPEVIREAGGIMLLAAGSGPAWSQLEGAAGDGGTATAGWMRWRAAAAAPAHCARARSCSACSGSFVSHFSFFFSPPRLAFKVGIYFK